VAKDLHAVHITYTTKCNGGAGGDTGLDDSVLLPGEWQVCHLKVIKNTD